MSNQHSCFIQNWNWRTSKAYILWAYRTNVLSFALSIISL